MENIHYQETQSAPLWTFLIAVVVVGILVFIMFFSSAYTEPIPDYLWWFFGAIIALLVFVTVNFAKLKIIITDIELDISYGIFHRRIPRRAIKKVEDIRLTFMNTGGIGIRISSLGCTVYNSRWGKALKVERNDGGKPVGFSANNPKQIKNILGF